MLTSERLRQLVTYDPITGNFYRNVNSWRFKQGELLGSKDVNGYVQIQIDEVRDYAHRLAFLYVTGAMPPVTVDHINMNKADNAYSNLRLATYSQNNLHRAIRSDCKSGYKGVSWKASHKLWRARTTVNGKEKVIGYFPTAEEASAAYIKFTEKAHGEFYHNPS